MSQRNNNSNIHIVSLNTQGLADRIKRARLIQWVKQQQANIVFLQETHFSSQMVNDINNQFDAWDNYHSFGTTNSRGCTIMISRQVSYRLIDTFCDNNGRFILLNIELFENTFTLLNIYSPNDKKLRNSFYREISDLLVNSSQGVKIVGGDHNDILNHNDRVYKSNNNKPKYVPVTNLKKLIKSHKLIDIWKNMNHGKSQYTWRRKNSVEKSRIDYWLVEENLIPLILFSDIRPALIQHTDHMAISLKLKTPNKRGKGFWKLNNSYLSDPDYVTKITNIIKTVKSLKIENQQTIWEICKIEVRDFSINFAKSKSRQRHNRLQHLEKELNKLITLSDTHSNDHT